MTMGVSRARSSFAKCKSTWDTKRKVKITGKTLII